MPRFVPAEFASADGTPLCGWLVPAALLSGQRMRGTIVLCHGLGADRTSMLPTAAMLHRRGYCTLLFDFRAHGSSGGSRCTLGFREADDVEAAVLWASGRPECREGPIAVLGDSMGAAAALMAAADCPRISATVAESPFSRLDRAVANQYRKVYGPLGPPLSWLPQRFGERLIGARVGDVAPVDAIARGGRRPVLLIQDANDKLCPPSETQALVRAAHGNAQLWTVPGAGHVEASFVAPAEYEKRVIGFLDAALKQERSLHTP